MLLVLFLPNRPSSGEKVSFVFICSKGFARGETEPEGTGAAGAGGGTDTEETAGAGGGAACIGETGGNGLLFSGWAAGNGLDTGGG